MEILRTEPWLTEAANRFLEIYFQSRKNISILEFGSGASTLWFVCQNNAGFIHSIEHDKAWFKVVEASMVHAIKSSNGRCVGHFELLDAPYYDKPKFGAYDLILVDGIDRVECIQHSKPHLNEKGILILDNSEREEYLPGIELLRDWPRIETYQLTPDKYGYTYPGWKTTIFFKP
jgi:predicted O-methyltransferase YrrM